MSREEAIKVLREFTDERKLSIVKNALETVISAEKESNVRESSKWDLSNIRTWQYIVSDVLTKREGIGNYLDDGGCQKIAKYMQEEWSKKLIPTRDCVIEALRTEYEKGRADAIAELNEDSIKSAWDEEDEHRIKDTIYFLETAKKHYASTVELDACISWLELLKKNKLNMNKIKPKFHKGDWIIDNCGNVWKIEGIINQFYILEGIDGGESCPTIEWVNKTFHLWTIQDAMDGDVLAVEPIDGYQFPFITIYKNRGLDFFNSYCLVGFDGKFYEGTTGHALDNIHPATKEQRDTLFAKMEEAGYEWDTDEKELRLIEYNGEDYGIDSLYHARRILEKTLGKVDGYQSDDGILEHKCAITVLKRLYEHKPIGWAQDNVKELNEFENAMLHVGMSFFGKNADLSPNDTDEVREQAKLLLGLAKTNEWSEEDSARLKRIADFLWKNRKGDTDTIYQQEQDANWLKSLESKCSYNPYKAVVESIAKMCDKYETYASDEAQMRDFLCNVKAKCHEAVEYDKKYCQN